MEVLFWMATVIPVIGAGGILHFRLKAALQGRWNILPKCLATWMAVCTALAGILRNKGEEQTGMILAALILFLLADALLELQFFAGMAVFAAGHLLLIIWFAGRGHHTGWNVLLWALLLAASDWVFRKELSRGKEHPGLYLMILYPAVLMAMVSMALTMPFMLGAEYLWAAAGAVLFGISDLMVGKGFFKKLPGRLDFLALAMYYCGIFCLGMITWAV